MRGSRAITAPLWTVFFCLFAVLAFGGLAVQASGAAADEATSATGMGDSSAADEPPGGACGKKEACITAKKVIVDEKSGEERTVDGFAIDVRVSVSGGGTGYKTDTIYSGTMARFTDTTGKSVTFTEKQPGDYALESASCLRYNQKGEVSETFPLEIKADNVAFKGNPALTGNGDNFDCTFRNKTSSWLEIKKSVKDAPATVTEADFQLDAVDGGSGVGAIVNHQVKSGSYTVTERLVDGSTSPPLSSYDKSYTCTVTNPITGTTTTTGPTTMDGASFPVTVGVGDHVSCTLLNTYVPTTLTLKKKLEAGAGDTRTVPDFTLSASSDEQSFSGVTGDESVTKVPVAFGVAYELGESFTDGSQGLTDQYDSSWSCTDGGALAAGHVTLTRGAQVTCTVTNTPIKPTLTLKKDAVVAKNGALVRDDQVSAQFDLSAKVEQNIALEGGSGISGKVDANTEYSLSETGGHAKFEPQSWTCSNVQGPVESVLLALGEDVTCTALNVAQAPRITLNKETWIVYPDDTPGYSHRYPAPGDALGFELTAEGDSETLSGTSGDHGKGPSAQVDPGSYTLSETPPSDSPYTLESWSCEKATVSLTRGAWTVAVGLGDDVTCTAVNTAPPPHLTLLKEVLGEDGQPLAETARTAALALFTLTATNDEEVEETLSGPSSVSGHVMAGDYVLTESSTDPNWIPAGGWTCVEPGPTPRAIPLVDGVLTLAAGDEVECTVTNQNSPTWLQLTKEFDPPGLGTRGDWTLKATPETGSQIAMKGDSTDPAPAVAGVAYTLTEDSETGSDYELTGWSCTNSTHGRPTPTVQQSGSGDTVSYTLSALDPGDHVICVATNKATTTPMLTITKKLQVAGTDYPAAGWEFDVVVDDDDADTIVTQADGSVTREVPAIGATLAIDEQAPTGYAPKSITCSRTSLGHTVDLDKDVAAVNLVKGRVDIDAAFRSAGDSIHCTFVNDAPGPSLLLTKQIEGHVMSGADLDAERAAFELTATSDAGTVSFRGDANPEDPDDRKPATVATYTLGEEAGAREHLYRSGPWSCTVSSTRGQSEPGPLEVDNGRITVGPEDLVSCVKVNTYEPAQLTLVKTVVDETGVTDATEQDWQLSAEPRELGQGAESLGALGATLRPDSGVGVAALGGVWYRLDETLKESDLTGLFTAGEWNCIGSGVEASTTAGTYRWPLGAHVTCTVTNVATRVPTLTLQKVALDADDEARPDIAGLYTLSATAAGPGPAAISGLAGSADTTARPLMPGTFTLAESGGPDGYDLQGWTCTDATDEHWAASGPSVSISPGQKVTCVATNVAEKLPITGADRFAVGDFVWHDANSNGRQDAGELGVAGVVVTLLRTNGAPARDASGELAQTTTDASGKYLLDNLEEGTYRLAVSSVPAGMGFTLHLAPGVPESLNSDIHPGEGVSLAFTLSSDAPLTIATPSDLTAAGTIAGMVDLNRDAGLVTLPPTDQVYRSGSSGSDAGNPGTLPYTGAGDLVGLSALSLATVAFGVMLAGRRRRRKEGA